MASSADFVEYACSQMRGAGTITYKKMFGEYGIYLNGKIIGLICDNQFYLKITASGRAKLKEAVEAPAYKGSKPYFLIEDFDDQDSLTATILATYEELPEAKAKTPKSANRKGTKK